MFMINVENCSATEQAIEEAISHSTYVVEVQLEGGETTPVTTLGIVLGFEQTLVGLREIDERKKSTLDDIGINQTIETLSSLFKMLTPDELKLISVETVSQVEAHDRMKRMAGKLRAKRYGRS